MQVPNGPGQGVRRSKPPLSACYTRRKFSLETSHKSVKDRVRVKHLVIVNYSVKYDPDIKKALGNYGNTTDVCYSMHCDLELGDLTTGQGNGTSFGHETQWSKILSRSNNHCSDSGKSIMHITGMLAYQPL